MKLFKNMKVRTKLIISFVAVAILNTLITVIGGVILKGDNVANMLTVLCIIISGVCGLFISKDIDKGIQEVKKLVDDMGELNFSTAT